MDNLVACYVDKLSRHTDETDADTLSTIVLLHDVLNAEDEKKELNFEILFKDETRGIISYLKTLSTKNDVNIKLIEELLNLLKCIIVDFTVVAAKYVSSLVEKFLEPTIMYSGSTPLRIMAYEILLVILRTPGIAPQPEWLDKFYQKLLHHKTEKSTIPSGEKKKVYQLLGEIIDYDPSGKDAKQIFRLLCSQIGKQIHYFNERSSNFRVNEMEGLYDCLQSFLNKFYNEDCVKNSTELYSFVKEGCGMEVQHRKTSIRAAFKILQNHFALFANNVFGDYVWWTDLLTRFLKSPNKDDQLAAFHAFNTFYRGVSKVLKEKSDQNNVLKYFIESLQKCMKKTSSNNEVALAVQNFGHFANVCKIYGEKEELKRMFALTAQIAENCCSGQMEGSIELHHMSSLLVSMSKITRNLYDENSYEDEFAIVGKFSAFVVISYPKVPNTFRFLVKNNLIKTFIIFGSISDTVLDSYLEKLMMTSLIKCCSCPLERDIEYLNSLGKTKNSNLTSCNEYLPLWKAICNIKKELTEHKIVSERKKIETVHKKNLPSKVFDIFIKNILSIFEKLDFSVIEDDSNNDEVGIIDNFGLTPKTESDFYIFVNLVELFSAVIDVCESDIFEKWIAELVTVFIKLSATCSIKSGFFQLLTVIFQRGKSQSSYVGILLELKSFIIETVVNLRKLKGVDLNGCLRMILKTPLIIVEAIRSYIVPVLQVVFTQGLEDLSLARSGLVALRTWKTYLGPHKFRPILEIIVPLLNPYLESKKSVGDTDTLTKYEERLIMPAMTTKNKIYKKFCNMNVNSSSTDLLKFQGEILAFLSEIDVDLCRTIYNPEKCITNEFTQVLRFDVPFRDKKVKIFLDKFLPRIIELTCHSNLRTRITACEMLHSMTIVFLGNTIAVEDGELSKPVENLFRQLVTCIFKLGSDDNAVIKVMFTQLSHQLVRYYSRERKSNVSALMLDILFDSVSHMHDISLRHFSAGVIKEFVRGSLKGGGISTNILAVMKYICLFCVQPCAFKRQGAALAFNSICGVVQGRSSVINGYFIELLVNFVKSSSLNIEYEYDDVETSNSLKHIKRVLLENSDVFLQPNSGRRVPKCLDDGTLKSVVVWLLKYCICENMLCRNICMDLMVDLCCKLPGIGSLEKFFSDNRTEDNIIHSKIVASMLLDENFLYCVDIRSHQDESYHEEFAKRTIKWLRSSLAGLHCLSWLLKEKVTSFSSCTSSHGFLTPMKFYCEFILPNDLNGYISERGSEVQPELIPSDLKAVYDTLKYEVFNEYLKILIICNILHFEECIGSEKWHTYFWRSCISFLFAPTTFAANSFTQECISDAIPKILFKLKETSADKQELIYEEIRQNSSHKLFDTFIENLESCDFVSLSEKQYIVALNELQKSQIISCVFPNVEERKRKILIRLFEYVGSGGDAKSRNPAIIMQLETLLVFGLTDCPVNFVLELIATPTILRVNNSVETTISHGRHFFNTFRKPITEFLSRYQKDVTDNYLLPAVLTKESLLIVIDCLKFFAESPKSINFDELIEGIFKNWSSLSCWSPGDDCAQYLLYLIDVVAVQKETLEKLSTKDKNPVFLWLLNYLLSEKRFLTGGKEYFKSLTPFISNANETNDLILLNKLKEFRDKYFETSSPTKLQDVECINMFKALLSLFCSSENIVVLKSIILIGVSYANEECDLSIEQTLENVMKKISVENQVKLINTVYELFNDVSQTAAFRLGCVKKFLIPLLYTSKEESLKIFFVDQTKNIIQMLKKPILPDSQESNLAKEILVKTAAVSIAEVYVDLESEDIKLAVSMGSGDKESVKTIISKNIWNTVITPVNVKDRSNESALRALKCDCYNTLIKILLKVPKPENCYTSVLSENADRRRFIWQYIIDLNEEINLKMYIDEIPARQKALKQKRKELKTKSMSGTSMRSIPTQYLSTSSLVSSVKYDMSEWNISNEGYIMQTENKSYTIDLEEDKLNNHECMASLCELIRFIVESNVTPLPDLELNSQPELPKWMESLRHSLKYALALGKRRKNVVLFLLKMIHNCQTIFCPYACGWIDLIIKCVLMLDEINYLTVDMIVMMISWCKVYIPTDKEKNNDLLTLVLTDIEKEETTVRNYRLDIARAFIKHWSQYLDVPYTRLFSINKRDEKAELLEVNLTCAKSFLLRGILPFKGGDVAADELSRALMFHVDRKDVNRSVKILNFEVLALILEVAKTNELLTSCREQLRDNLVTKLNSLRVDNTQTKTDLFFSCLLHTLICFPTILHRFIPYLDCNFQKFQGKIKAQCLHMMTLDDNVPDNLFSQLMTMQFTNCLRDSNHEIVKNALIFVKKFIQTLKVNELLAILPDIIRLSSHPTSECRQLVYEIADSVYKNYKNETSDESRPIKSQCKVILLNGLLDGDKVLQEKIFESWKERCNFSDKIVDRFISIVKEMYSPENESRFVNYATDYLLDASSETPDYKSKIFDNPLSSSIDFREQDFTPLSLFKNKHPIAPIFVNSLSNQLVALSLYTSKMCTLVMPGSQQKVFYQPSQNTAGSSHGTGLSNAWQWSVNSNSSLPDYSLDEPELRKLRNRLQSNKREASKYYAMKNVEKREKRIEILKTRSDRVEKDVQFSRTYRDGEFPDIEISRSAIINPLKILGKKDPVIARLVFIGLFDGMLSDDVRKKDHLKAIGDGFNDILKHTVQHNNVLIETIFETVFFHSNDVQLESQKVVISSHASGLLSLGTLILENSLHSEMMLSTNPRQGAKRMRVDDSAYRTKWIQLAELYKALDQNDVVNGILKEKIEGRATESLKEGLALEQISDWKNACTIYDGEINQLLNSETQSFEGHFIFDAYLKCAANLSEWSDVKNMITKKFQNLDDLWLESWDTEHTLPWFFTAEAIICAQKGNDHCVQLNNIKRWSKDEVKSTILNNLITESMAILLFLNHEHFEAKHKVKKCVESMLQNWNHSTASLNKFYKLLTLSEIDSMLAPYSDLAPDGTLSADSCRRIVDMWESSPPRCDNLYWWDKRIEYRRLFAREYVQRIDEEHRGTVERLRTFGPRSCLQMVDVALQQQNEKVAEKYLLEVACYATEYSITTDLDAPIALKASKLYLLVAKKLRDAARYVKCLQSLDEYSWNEQLSYEYHVHTANTLRELLDDWSSFDFDTKEQLIKLLGKLFDRPEIVADTVRVEMREAVGEHFRKAATFAESRKLPPENTAAAYLSLAKHSEELLIGNDESISAENLVHKENYIRYILRALKFDSREAQLLFPTLLQIKQITNETLKSVFVAEATLVEEWKFLIWIQQLLAHIDTDKLPLIQNLLLNIIEKYPNAIQFSIFSSDLMRYTYQNDAAKQLAERLRETLNRNSAIADFVKAVSCVRIPEGYFFHHMKKLSRALRRNDVSQIVSIEKEMFGDSARFKGKLFSQSRWWETFRRLFASIENQSTTAASQLSEVDGYVTKLREESAVAKMRDRRFYDSEDEYRFLRNYSCWFDDFSILKLSNIEIPGQYDGFAPPNPERHVRIFEFDKYVQVQCSVQAPIKIRVTGDDAKKYSYLIKFGEDTRQDQRIQQIFSIMNRCNIADSEASGSGGNVSVITYGVFPLTTYFGIIEWLERTTSLRDFMNESDLKMRKLRAEYDENIRRYDRSNQILAHEKAVKNFSKDVIVSTFERIQNDIPQDVFRKSILALCNSPIMYWNLRNQFMISYSSLCIYGWILGIGDRHLSNFLVCLKTGRCVGIDFGHAFGTGTTNQEVPELIPFRMTPHIVDIMQPFGLTGLIRETMVNALKIIHKNEYILFATMQIFILDPSFNWLKSIKRRRQELTGIEETEDAQWYPALKIGRIRRKLGGINPVKILEEEVEENLIISTGYKNGCIKLLNREDSWRSRLPSDNISLAEQVDSLLDIATDKSILGVSFGGLETYV